MSRLTTRNETGQAILQNYFDPGGDSNMWVEEAARRNLEAIEKLAKYEDFEEHVGKDLYSIHMECNRDYKPEYCKDHEGGCEKCSHRHPELIHYDEMYWGDFPNIGKTAFYTEAEAIEAIAAWNRRAGE